MAGGRKRAVKKDTMVEVQEEENEEPVVKKGRGGGGRQKTIKVADAKKKQPIEIEEEPEEMEEEPTTSTTLIKKGKRGAGRTTKIKEEEIDEEEKPAAVPNEPENRRGKRVRKPVTKTEDEAAAAPIMPKRGRAAVKKEARQKEDEPTIKEKKGRKPAVKKEPEDEEENIAAITQKGKKGKETTTTGKKQVKVKKEEDEDIAPSTSKGRKKGGKKDTLPLEVATQEEEKTVKVSGGRQAKPKVTKAKKRVTKAATAEEKENTDTSNLPTKSGKKTGVDRVVVVKGRAAVDALCPIATHSHVYEDEDDNIWDCMLNQTNIQFNNNKYYLIQLLEDDSSKSYSVWMRWGRVGANGQNSLQPCGADVEKAMNIFRKKFSDKTKNDWEFRFMFEKVPGKYDLLKMDYSKGRDTPDTVAVVKKSKEKAALVSQLHHIVKAVIELICDVRQMEEAVVEMKYDAKKAPLGKLTTQQITAGYLALKRIELLTQKDKYAQKDLVQACNDFYTRIPHYFGMKVPPLIRTSSEVREKVALLEALGDIQAALSVLDQHIDVNVHPTDQHYNNLKCDLTPLQKESQEYKILEQYMQTTHAKTHNQYKLELLDVLVCYKESEHKRFKDVGNRMLLWHGSRISNWAGILSQGLRIAPPEAPVTGYMFGKGIYFADMASKSANYCWANSSKNVGFLLLSEVALGKCNELFNADYDADKLPQGCHSVKGCGRTAPQPKNFTKLPDGTVVPLGPGTQVAAKTANNYSLLYNEYIVYDTAQVLTRYLLKVKFNFK